ncbi:LysR substrate-binding domain-containing protein [Algihabitans albus]|uniref:LysR substrate-binding domain-containing protein n=1 Tax=Algihabitans albus TaxID=2164067 RepID=UPI000E5D4BD3|nr:LysR substrate-binding domain-containing protein [Algihabitans albus]
MRAIGPFVLPRVLKGLRQAYPDLKLFLREEQPLRLLERLRSGEIGAAFIALPYEVADCEVMELGADPLWLVAPPNHPLILEDSPAVSAADLSPDDLLLLEDGHCLREHALAACHMHQAARTEGYEATVSWKWLRTA